MDVLNLQSRLDHLPTILVVGDVMLDRYWYGEVARISPEAPVPVVHVAREDNRLGGAGNVALNLKALRAPVTLLSLCGMDPAGQQLQNLADELNLRAHWVADKQWETVVKLRIIGRSQQMLRLDFERPPQSSMLDALAADYQRLLVHHGVVLFSDYDKGALSQVHSMISQARAQGKTVLVDPKGLDFDRYAGASLLTPNLRELAAVVGSWKNEEQLFQKAQNLRTRLGLDALLLTRSEQGMTLFDEQGAFSVPALVHEVADVTGAGDTVIALMAIALAAGWSCRRAMELANRGASRVVTKFGTATLNWDELQP